MTIGQAGGGVWEFATAPAAEGGEVWDVTLDVGGVAVVVGVVGVVDAIVLAAGVVVVTLRSWCSSSSSHNRNSWASC